ncbi:MAG: AAA family ATPase [Phycisphaerae bacterium]
MPPYLAGREDEQREFARLLDQDVILENLILTGLRGLGKTVLLETFKPLAINAGWLWAGADLSESTSISEESLATRLLTDLSIVTSQVVVAAEGDTPIGFTGDRPRRETALDFPTLLGAYQQTPGLIIDKLKAVLEWVWSLLAPIGKRGIVFAYDEAQNLADHAPKEQYPLSLLLDLFQSLQRKDIRFMLALTGLPTLFPKLVESRTYSERMFRVLFLKPLSHDDTIEAIRRPVQREKGFPIEFSSDTLTRIWSVTKGYPYFVQFVCREVFDVWVQSLNSGQPALPVPMHAILRKLDTDFFAGRWAKATDRQRDLLTIIAGLQNCDQEFTVQDITESAANRALETPFSSSHVNQMLTKLADVGLIFKNRHGKYSFAVPLLGDFIQRQRDDALV